MLVFKDRSLRIPLMGWFKGLLNICELILKITPIVVYRNHLLVNLYIYSVLDHN